MLWILKRSLFPLAGQRGSDPDGGSHQPLLPLSQNHLEGVQTCSKLKLQLFPIDDGTRRALEMVRLILVHVE